MLKNKRAVSEMLSYVLIVAIAITLSVAVYSWIMNKFPSCPDSNPDCILPTDCNEETSVIMTHYNCSFNGVTLTIMNNGRFNVNGIMLSVSNDTNISPQYALLSYPKSKPGQFDFSEELKPGMEENASYSSLTIFRFSLKQIKNIQIQPFILKGKGKILCKKAVIREKIENCAMT